MNQRNLEIIRLHNGTKDKKGLTYAVLAKKYGVTSSRIGQICNPKEKIYYYCEKHNKRFSKKCLFCEIDNNYSLILDDPKHLIEEIELLRIPSRKEGTVRKRKILITKLVDELGFSFSGIGRLLKIDHTTAMYSYYSYGQGRIIKNKK